MPEVALDCLRQIREEKKNVSRKLSRRFCYSFLLFFINMVVVFHDHLKFTTPITFFMFFFVCFSSLLFYFSSLLCCYSHSSFMTFSVSLLSNLLADYYLLLRTTHHPSPSLYFIHLLTHFLWLCPMHNSVLIFPRVFISLNYPSMCLLNTYLHLYLSPCQNLLLCNYRKMDRNHRHAHAHASTHHGRGGGAAHHVLWTLSNMKSLAFLLPSFCTTRVFSWIWTLIC